MRYRLPLLLCIAALVPLLLTSPALAQPRNQFPAESVKFDDGRFLQAKHDEQCGHLVVTYNTGTIETTAIPTFEFGRMSFPDAGRVEALDIGNKFTQPTADIIEWTYDPADDESGWFRCSVLITGSINSTGVQFVSWGFHENSALVEGDQLDTNTFASVIGVDTTHMLRHEWSFDLDDLDHIGPMRGPFVGTSTGATYVTLECVQENRPELGAEYECWR